MDSNWKDLVKDHKQKLKGFKGEISLHGVFQDMNTTSNDKRIVAVCKERFLHNLKIAAKLDAKIVIFHSDFNPLMKNPLYTDRWIKKKIKFMKEIVNYAKKYKIIILLENLWEPKPEVLRKVIKSISSPYLKALLDTGHANIFSEVPLEQWIKVLKGDLIYLHLNDNKGDFDSELPLGKGNINWKKIFFELNKLKKFPRLCFEVAGGKFDKITNTVKSIEYLKKRQ